MGRDTDELRVLVVDDHPLYRRGLVIGLEDTEGLEVVAEASSGEEAVDSAIALAPDVVLMDVRMPGMGGIEATRRLSEQIPATRVLMLSVSDDDEDLFEAVKAGAVGYLLKETSVTDVADATRRVASGQSFVSPSLAARLLAEFASMNRRLVDRDGEGRGRAALTNREVEVLQAMAQGADNAQIATIVKISEHSVRNHVRNILEKLELQSRAEAVLFAIRTHLTDP